MCAAALFPIPKLKTLGSAITLSIFPVMMNVLDASAGNCLNPFTACWAAKRGEMALTANSRVVESRVIFASGSEASPGTLCAPVLEVVLALHLRSRL